MAGAKVGPTKLAGLVDTSKQNVQRWAAGTRRLEPDWAQKIAPHLSTTAERLLLLSIDDDSAFDPDRQLTEDDKPFADALPQMVGRIGGGSTGAIITIEMGEMRSREPVSDWWRIPPAVLRGLARSEVQRTIAFAVDGDSMEPTIQRTDIVFIDTGRQKIEPDGIWAVDYGLGRTLKRITVRKVDGELRFTLKSDNKAYPDEEYAESEVTVFGRYIGRFSVF